MWTSFSTLIDSVVASPGAALGTGEFDSPLQVLNSHRTLVDINIAYTNSQSLREAVAKGLDEAFTPKL